jgi:CheY-like chemotaxis protein
MATVSNPHLTKTPQPNRRGTEATCPSCTGLHSQREVTVTGSRTVVSWRCDDCRAVWSERRDHERVDVLAVSPTRKHATILVVDDDAAVRAFLRRALTLAGHRVLTAAGGGEALAAIDRSRPDVVVIDLGLPGVSGRDIFKDLTAHRPGLVIGVVVITGSAADDLIGQGAVVLHKPVSTSRLLEAVEELLAPA